MNKKVIFIVRYEYFLTRLYPWGPSKEYCPLGNPELSLLHMRGRRVLNEHHFERVVVPTYPRHQNIFQNFQVLRCVDFKARFDEMRRHHLTITCNGCKNHHRSWIFTLHHRRNFWRIEGNYPSVLFICNLINNELFLVDKNADMFSLCVSDGSEALGIFQLRGLWSG